MKKILYVLIVVTVAIFLQQTLAVKNGKPNIFSKITKEIKKQPTKKDTGSIIKNIDAPVNEKINGDSIKVKGTKVGRDLNIDNSKNDNKEDNSKQENESNSDNSNSNKTEGLDLEEVHVLIDDVKQTTAEKVTVVTENLAGQVKSAKKTLQSDIDITEKHVSSIEGMVTSNEDDIVELVKQEREDVRGLDNVISINKREADKRINTLTDSSSYANNLLNGRITDTSTTLQKAIQINSSLINDAASFNARLVGDLETNLTKAMSSDKLDLTKKINKNNIDINTKLQETDLKVTTDVNNKTAKLKEEISDRDAKMEEALSQAKLDYVTRTNEITARLTLFRAEATSSVELLKQNTQSSLENLRITTDHAISEIQRTTDASVQLIQDTTAALNNRVSAIESVTGELATLRSNVADLKRQSDNRISQIAYFYRRCPEGWANLITGINSSDYPKLEVKIGAIAIDSYAGYFLRVDDPSDNRHIATRENSGVDVSGITAYTVTRSPSAYTGYVLRDVSALGKSFLSVNMGNTYPRATTYLTSDSDETRPKNINHVLCIKVE